ncbi:MAG: class I SAM-dependent methyltransferase [Magnetococcus sp. WYHC-3]
MTFQPRDYWENRLKERCDLQGVGFITLPASFNRWMYRIRAFAFRDALARAGVDPSGQAVLDIGSGTGFYVRLWQQMGASSVVGADLTQTSVEYLSRTFPESRFLRQDLGRPLEADLAALGPYPLVSAMDMLYHIIDEDSHARALGNLARMMTPDGVLICSENLYDTPRDMGHFRGRTQEVILDRLRQAGLFLHQRRPMFVVGNNSVRGHCVWAQRTFRELSRMARLGTLPGWVAGAVAWLLDRALIPRTSQGCSTEILILRKTPL